MFITNAERRRWLAFQWDRYPAHIPGSRWNLKTIKKEAISSECYTILEKSDWRVIKAKELGEELDSDWKTFRESVRAKCNSMQSQIDGATSVVKLMELYEYTEQEDGSQTRPLGEFPIKA